MSLRIATIGLSCCVCFATVLNQAVWAKRPEKLACGIHEHRIGNMLRLEAWISSENFLRGKYELRVETRGAGGQSVTVQAGEFATPGTQRNSSVVSQVVINKSDYEASFIVRSGGRQKFCTQERPRTNTSKPGTDI